MKSTVNADRYVEKIKQFTEELTIYEGEPDLDIDLSAGAAYSQAVMAAEEWMRLVLFEELESDPALQEARCILKLPAGDLMITIQVESSEDSSRNGLRVPELLDTPIGCIDEYTWKCIHRGSNPVRELYRGLGVLSRHIHNLLAMREVFTDLPTLDMLLENGINDPNCIYQMDSLLSNIDEFLDKEYDDV